MAVASVIIKRHKRDNASKDSSEDTEQGNDAAAAEERHETRAIPMSVEGAGPEGESIPRHCDRRQCRCMVIAWYGVLSSCCAPV